MTSILKIVNVEPVKESTRGQKYRTVYFKGVKFIGNLQINSNSQPTARNVWGEFKDSEGREFKADPIFTDLLSGEIAVGSAIEGQIMQFATTPYELNGSQRTTYTMPIYSNEYNKANSVANQALKSNKASVVDEDGVVVAPKNLVNNPLVEQD